MKHNNSNDSGQTDAQAAADKQVVFHAEGLTKVYQMGEVQVHALRGVDLDLYDGELVVLLGASGSGKSTLLNILGGLDSATSGSVYYLDHNLVQATERSSPSTAAITSALCSSSTT